jgi:hypothetical protein
MDGFSPVDRAHLCGNNSAVVHVLSLMILRVNFGGSMRHSAKIEINTFVFPMGIDSEYS